MKGLRTFSYPVFALQAIPLIAGAVVVCFTLTHGKPWDLRRCLGTLLLGAGVALWAVARIQLGRSFAVKATAHRLITHGLYAKIRNPIYVFGTMMLAGFVVLIQRPVLWLVLAALVVMQVIRARREAVVLEAAFGEEYRHYRSRTWF